MTDPKPTLRQLLREGHALLAASESARLDAEVLLASTCQLDRVALYRDGDAPLTSGAVARFRRRLRARRLGVPLAYLTGTKEFWSLELQVSAATLVPRPETELLVQLALDVLPSESDARILDLGTGSGAIVIALARERPRVRIDAVERSPGALRIAERNVVRLAPGRVRLLQGDWFTAVPPGNYDLIVSNPPYVCSSDPALRQGPTGFEPRAALDGGMDGMAAIRHIIERTPARLRVGGRLLLEHGATQAGLVRECMTGHGFTDVVTAVDLQGHDRVTMGCL